jgi:hypothetical protein
MEMTARNLILCVGWFVGWILVSYLIWGKLDIGIVIGAIVFAPWTRILSLFQKKILS